MQCGKESSPKGIITIMKVLASDNVNYSNAQSSLNAQEQPVIICPERILVAFKELLKGTKVLGITIHNPYGTGHIKIPSSADKLTPQHLQILARNEICNDNGCMETQLYNGLLDDYKIASLRCLVKGTTVAGFAYPPFMGGFNGVPITKIKPTKTIVIDQSGLQWHSDIRDTGSMFFYPDKEPDDQYLGWQNNIYKEIYGKERPQECSVNSIALVWRTENKYHEGSLDLDQVQMAIKEEFLLSLKSVVHLAGNDPTIKKLNFKFLKADKDYLADDNTRIRGYNGQSYQLNISFHLLNARLNGIKDALQTIQELPEAQRKSELGKISSIELPCSNSNVPILNKTLKEIEELVNLLELNWFPAENADAFTPRSDYVNATTNYGSPHAMIGNLGGYSSVDGAIFTNSDGTLMRHNAAYNTYIKYHIAKKVILSISGLAIAGGITYGSLILAGIVTSFATGGLVLAAILILAGIATAMYQLYNQENMIPTNYIVIP